MGFGYILAGLAFLANPCVNIFDIFPDIFGCILLLFGLFKLSDVDGRFYFARKCVFYMCGIFTLKLLLSVYCTVRWQDLLTSLTMCFSIMEIIVFVYFFGNLYGGIEYTLTRNTDASALPCVLRAKKSAYIFAISKSVIVFLPELITLLSSNSEEAGGNIFIALSYFKPYFIVLSVIITLALGIYFIRQNAVCLSKLKNDKIYSDAIFAIYNENVLSNKRLLLQRHTNRAFVLLALSVIFLFDITIDGINLLPDTFGYILLGITLFFLCRKFEAKEFILSISLITVSVCEYIFRLFTNFGVNLSLGYGLALAKNMELLKSPISILLSLLFSAASGTLFVLLLIRLAKKFNSISNENEIPSAFSIRSSTILALVYVFVCSVYELCPILSAYLNHLYRSTQNMEYFRAVGTLSNLRYAIAFLVILAFALLLRNVFLARSKMRFRL